MRTAARVTVVVLGLLGGLGGLSWPAADACLIPREPPPGAVPLDAKPATELDGGAALLMGLTAVVAARWSGARRVPSFPG